MKTYIYSLSHPITNEVRYIGKANNIKNRYKSHLQDKSKTKKNNWIRSLKSQGLLPVVEEVDCINLIDWAFWEQHYISLFKSWGFKLTNGNNGGEGSSGWKASKETKENMRNAQLGKKHTPEAKEKQRNKQLGVSPSIETREKLRQINLGKKQPLSAIAKTVAANTGRKRKEGTGARISAATKGKKRNPESIAKMVETNKRPLLQFDKDWDFLREFASSKDANLFYGKNSHNLSDYFKGKKKTWLGFNWKYKE